MPLEPERPVLSGTYPDPSVCASPDGYYLVTSTFEYFPGLPVFHSPDLRTWTQVGHVIDRLDQLDLTRVPSSGGLYAPTIRWHDGTFYLTCTLVNGSGREGNFVMTATDAAGPWSDPFWLDDAPGFDPSLTFSNGRAYYLGTRLAQQPQWHHEAEVWLQELDLEAMQLTGEKRVLWHGAVEGAVWAEGPHVYEKDGWFYLVASEGGTEDHHAVSVARSRDILGPYEGCKGNPLFTHRTLGLGHPIVGVGHPDLIEDAHGQWWAFMLGSRPVGGFHANLGRETFVVAVDWEHGWPVFAPGVGQLAIVDGLRRIESSAVVTQPWTQVRTGRLAGTVDGTSITVEPGPALDAVDTPAFIGLRQRHHRFTFGATVAPGGGIALRQSEDAHVLFSAEGLVRRSYDGVELVAEVGDASRLEVRGDGQEYSFFADARLVATVDGRFLSTQSGYAAGHPSFLGVWLGVFSSSETAITATDVVYAAS
jgi:xylan 1,4-beta-xylosidase